MNNNPHSTKVFSDPSARGSAQETHGGAPFTVTEEGLVRFESVIGDLPIFYYRFEKNSREAMKAFFGLPGHRHPEFIFIHSLRGELVCDIEGEKAEVKAGEAVFINSERAWSARWAGREMGAVVLAFLPGIFSAGSRTAGGYIMGRTATESEDYILLSADIPWQNEALGLIKQFGGELKGEDTNPMRLLGITHALCAGICEHIEPGEPGEVDSHAHSVVMKMAAYIHRNYRRRLTLEDIAQAGAVSRSRCCQLFNQYLGTSPIRYLITCRINHSAELLTASDGSITEIALQCGFPSYSYFIKTFRREMNTTPARYRETKRAR